MHSVEVRLGNTNPGSAVSPEVAGNALCARRAGRLGSSRGPHVQLACSRKLQGRYLTIQILSAAGTQDVLSMAEVQLQGRPAS